MAKIVLHTPMGTSDETTTEYEANDIVLVKSMVGDDSGSGTHFWLRGIEECQYCQEPAAKVKKMVEENKTEDNLFSIVQSGSGNAMAVGNSNQATSGGKEGGWTISGWWITLIGTLVSVVALTMAILR